jgi:uncharacterized membrane protein YcgQ (UPF0703/DUF1980 family)
MRNTILTVTAVILMLLTGCQTKAPVNPSAKNANGTVAVNIPANDKEEPAQEYKIEEEPPLENGAPPREEPLTSQSGDAIEIKEKMFVTQTNDIYNNAEDYLGKTIKYEGIFGKTEIPETNAVYYSVIRYGPGCCGTDANCGFEVIWDKKYPAENDWVEATGILEQYAEDDYQYLRLRLSSLKVLPERGEERVVQ